MKGIFFGGLLIALASLAACQSEVERPSADYSGPIMETSDFVMLYSDSARLMVKMATAKRLQMLNGDQIFPRQVNIYFYNKAGQETTTLRADSGRFYPTKRVYRVIGHVVVVNKAKNETLHTDELTWEPDTKKVYTDKLVDIITPTQHTQHRGMTANQDFSEYSTGPVTGQFEVSDLPQ